MTHERLNVADRDRIDTGKRLVEQHVSRAGRERSRNLHSPALATGERDRGRLAHARDVEFLEQGIELALALAAIRLDHFEHRADVVLDVETAEDRGLLRQIADAEPRALVHRQTRDVVAFELDAATVGLDEPGDHVEHRGLAGAVRAEESYCLAAAHVEACALDYLAAPEGFLDPMHGK